MKFDDESYFSTGPIYGVIETILTLYKKYNNISTILVFEGNKKNNPRYKAPYYKQKRATMKSIDITNEMILIRNMVSMMGMISVIPQKGEADDGIANISQRLLKENLTTLILSNDHDMNVLLNKQTNILKKNTINNDMLTEKEFIKLNGYEPRHFSLLLATAGDKSDDIPGIKGIGEAKAKAILQALTEKNKKICTHTIAHHIYKTYKNNKTLLTQDEIEAQLNEYYNLTKIRKNWPVTIIANKDMNLGKILNMFKMMRCEHLIKNFNNIKDMCKNFANNEQHILNSILD